MSHTADPAVPRCVCVCVCAQPVRARACWSAGTASASPQRFAAMARMTVRTAAMKSTAAESRVRHLSAHPSFELFFFFSSVFFFCPLTLPLPGPAQSSCTAGQPSCISASCAAACGASGACEPGSSNCSECLSALAVRCLPLLDTLPSCPPSALRAHQPGAVQEPALQHHQLAQLPGPPVPAGELRVLGGVAVPGAGPDRLLPVPHVLRLHAARPQV